MAELKGILEIGRCPHCQIDMPSLNLKNRIQTISSDGRNQRFWGWYVCARCGGMVSASATHDGGAVEYISPSFTQIDRDITQTAREYLTQAVQSLHAPAGAVMLAASSVDAMLKDKGYVEGSLYARINQAKEAHLITEAMAEWAHEVRLDANDQRHADEDARLPDGADAQRCIDFAQALGQFLYVLPELVNRGRKSANPPEES